MNGTIVMKAYKQTQSVNGSLDGERINIPMYLFMVKWW